MATTQASTELTGSVSLAKWGSWIAALGGLWVLVSPFVLTGAITTGTPMYSNVGAGIVILVLAAYGASVVRTTLEDAMVEWSGWIAALAGLWILVSPFVLTGDVASGTVMYSNVIAGLVALVLGAYEGYGLQEA